MVTAFVIVGLILAAVVFLYFMGSSKGTDLIHRQTVRTILLVFEMEKRSKPNKPLHEIYLSIAQERNELSPTLRRENYLAILEVAGCFDESHVMKPEAFAEIAADAEGMIRKDLAESL